MIEALVGQGFSVAIHDYDALRHPVFGTNQAEWNRHAHLEGRMVDTAEDLIAGSDVVVLAQFNRRYVELLERAPDNVAVIDLSGLTRTPWREQRSTETLSA